MSAAFKLAAFGKFVNEFWASVTPNGDIVVTSWTDANEGSGRFFHVAHG